MSVFASAARYADTGGPALVAARAVEKAIFDSPLENLPLQRAYWAVAPRYYRHQPAETDRYPREVEPFEVAWVDPSAITRFTGQEYPFWVNIKHQFGTVRGGNWDRREPPIDIAYDGTPPALYLADRFEETVLHRSLRERFDEGIPWEETAFVQTATEIVREGGTVWNGCQSVADVERTCDAVDRLYESMRQRGCLSYRTVLRERDALDVDYLQCLKGEILVNVARDGELLFVDGRHRLSIAKLLGVERVPIAVLVRHSGWMRSRNPGVAAEVVGHPDLRSEFIDR
jgi:hypothetical protein